MNRKVVLIVALVLALGALSAGIATAAGLGGGDDDEQPISGAALAQARAAALAETGGGRVTDTEIGDEESYYEVEVTRADGSQVDVQLDRSFNVVGGSPDNESGDDRDQPDAG
jgi:Peptidase propeptide and YPEB domain